MHGIVQLNYSLLRSISSYTKYLNINNIKNILISLEKKKSKQFNLYGKLTKINSNFDFNWAFFKLWFIKATIYIYYLVNNEPYIVMVYYINDL